MGSHEGSEVGMRFEQASKTAVTRRRVPEPSKVSWTEFKLGEWRRAAGVSRDPGACEGSSSHSRQCGQEASLFVAVAGHRHWSVFCDRTAPIVLKRKAAMPPSRAAILKCQALQFLLRKI